MNTGILNRSGLVHAIVVRQGLNVAACGEPGVPRAVTPVQIRVYSLPSCTACRLVLLDRAREVA